jgi:hypothetical protein
MENQSMKRPSINKAVLENTVYNGFRWLLVDRELDANIIHDIQPTKITKLQHLGYIAKLNTDKTQILNVYLDRKTAAHVNKISCYSVEVAVKYGTIYNGYYYVLYDECDDDLKHNFVKPILYKDGIGKYDSNNNLIKEFICKQDCCIKEKITNKTLTKALTNNIMYNNYYYRQIGSKLQCNNKNEFIINYLLNRRS